MTFEQDLNHLVKHLNQFLFLDVYGIVCEEKAETYRLMTRTCFPNSQIHVRTSRLRLWLGLGQEKVNFPMGSFSSAQPDPSGALICDPLMFC